MGINKEILYSLRDISIIPSVVSEIESRSECNPTCFDITRKKKGFLPIITAPMSCVIDENNFKEYDELGISVILPRTVSSKLRIEMMTKFFCAFSIKETEDILEFPVPAKSVRYHILIDVANGHMKKQVELCRKLKEKFGTNAVVMVGNIANPETYKEYENVGADFIRIGIGGGSGCLSSTQTGVHYPLASLIDDIKKLKTVDTCKIIADGGISNYSDIIKCIALGADYVMCGKIFTKAAKSGETIGENVSYYGMSTKKAQQLMGKKITELKTSEGKEIILKKEYTLKGWVENMYDYLCSAMSYCNSRNLETFRRTTKCQIISQYSSSLINDK
jgi:GMP reductase